MAAIPPLTLILAAVSTGLAWLSAKGWYFVAVMPVFASICLAPFVVLALKWAHCRNKNLGLAFGLFFGAAIYLGHFHALHVLADGLHALPHVETFPAFVTDTVHDWRMFHRGHAVPPSPFLNWIIFGAELVGCALVAGVSGSIVGEQPYCERCGRWMKSTKAFLWPLAGHAVVAALRNGTMDKLPDLTPRTGASKVSHSRVEIHYCRHAGLDEGTFFLTAIELSKDEKKTTILTLMRNTEIMPDEAATIVSKCKAMAMH